MSKENNNIKYDNDYINQFLDRCKSFPRVKVELVEPNVLRVETDKMYEGYAWIGASEHNINNGCRGVKEYNYALIDSTHLTIYFISDGEDNERLKDKIKELKAELVAKDKQYHMMHQKKGVNNNMTRKDYILIADAIKENVCCANCVDKSSLITSLISIFKQDNLRFDADRFKAYIND